MRSTTLIRVLRAAADADPERVVYRYLADGERESASLTRGQLDDRARRIAAILQRRFSPGERVVLLFPSGLDFAAAFWGSLYAGVIAVPVAVPRATGDTRTLEGIVRSAAARGLLGPAGILQDFAGLEATRGVAQVALEEADRAPASLWQEPRVSGSDLAYLQYTSGSTASPKGVMVSHENVLRNIEYIDSGFRHTPESLCVVWLPHYHDMGLVYGMVQPVCTGAASVLFPPLKFVQRPLRWLAVITRWRATHSGAPNFAYDLCCRRVSAADRAELDLSSWSVAFNGAEPVRAATLREFAATFASCGFRASALCPAYGLAEATLKVTARDPERPAAVESTAPFAPARADLTALAPAREVVGCGSANGGTEVLIVDPDTCAPVPCGAVGEIWVRGPGVALGYWNLPEETERVFHARVSGGGAICFLRTGDLGFSRDGELFVTGRLKDLVIIRGQNYYPEDLEAAAAAADAGLRSSGVATFALDTDDGERAVIAAEVERSRDTAALDSMARRIAAAVQSRHQIPIHAVAILRRGGLPRTTSGKVQRHECRRRFAAGELDAMHVLALGDAGTPEVDRVTRQTLEACDAADRMPLVLAYVRRAVAAAARLPLEHVEADAVLTATGVDSLAASELCARFAEDLAVEIAPVRLLSGMTVRALVADLAARLEQAPASAWGAGEDEPGAYPLSCAQESLWASYALDPASAAYNIARAFRCTGPFDVPAFRACVGRLVERHSALRTTVANTLEGPMRVVHPRGSVTVLFDDASAWREADLMERIRQVATWPFLVEADALLRVAVFRRADQHIVVLCAHHIAVDLQSMEIVLEELGELYGAAVAGREAPPPVPSGAYGAFVDWHRQLLTGDTGARLWSYWRRVLGGEPPVLELPSDYSREAVRSHAGGTRTATVPADVHDRLRELSVSCGTTMYVTLLAVYLVLLHRYTGQRLVWVGSPVSGRHRPEFARTVGHFADLVVLSATIDPRETFAGLVARVRKTVLEALDHAAFPFRLLVQRLAPARDASRTPLVQALFALYRGQRFTGVETAPLWIGHAGAVVPFGPLRWESMALESGTSQFDVSLLVTEAPRGLAATLEFDARLFAPETAGRLLAHFVRVAELVSARWDRPLLEMQTLHDHERSRILYDWNATRAAYERDVLLHELVERQAARSPGACALLFGDDRLSYAALMERAGTLARRLQAIGVGPDSRVGVCMHRSIDLLVGLLAILRAGGAYVPVDPDYPEAYLRELIQDSGMAVLLAQEDTRERVRALGIPWIDVTSGAAHGRAMEGAARAPQRPSPLDLAYVIYTSGSTGKPKGVMNTHAGICNRLQWMQDAFRLDETDTVLQKTPLTFDVSVWELFWPLTAGARLAIAKPGGHRDADYLVGAIRAHEVTTVHFVPPMLRVLLEAPDLSGCTTLRRVICSGETLPEATQRRFGERLGAELFNLYGPTEAAVDVSWWPCRPGTGDARVPIGRPIANVRLHVLDENLEPVPPGAKGQIFIGGVALARGYLNRPDLTAERFVPDPFGDEGAGRLYATGDIGRHRADGAIEFLERSDHQVKIRGFRVELDEVASAVRRCHGVRDCVVVRVDAANGSDMLAAYVVADPTVTRTSLKQRLAALLPEFMVPASIVLLDALPLAASGKVDRQKLPPPSRAADGDLEYVAPRTALEAAVSRVWAQAFDVPQVGVDDNFFDLAGHSLLAMEIVTRLNHEFQVNLPLALLLSGAPSVALVAKALADQLGERSRELV